MEFILIILSALLFTAPYHFPTLFFLSWFAFIPLIYLIRKNDYSHSLIIALFVGFLNALFSFFWLYQPLNSLLKMPFSFNLVVLLIYFLLSGLPLAIWALINKFLQPKKSYSPFIAALSWSSLEYLRFQFFNFNPLNYFAYSQSSFTLINQYAAYGGIFLVSFITVLIASYLVKCYLLFDWKKIVPLIIIILFLISFPYFNSSVMEEKTIQSSADLLVGSSFNNKNFFEKIEKEIVEISNLTADSKSKYIFTPEKSLNFDFKKNNYYRDYLFSNLENKLSDSYLQIGSLAVTDGYNSKTQNSLFLLSDQLEIINRSNKKKNILDAVNFPYLEEFINFCAVYLNINNDLTKTGEAKKIIELEEINYLNLFSEEIFIPLTYQKQDYLKLTNLIVHSADEKTVDSKVYNQFTLAAAVYRAAESRTDLIRAVSGGYSAYINEKGEIIFKEKIENNIKTAALSLEKKTSYYQEYPQRIVIVIYSIFLIIVVIKILLTLRNKYSSRD